MPPISIYIHIPFCLSKCPYCDFSSQVAGAEPIDAYVAALCLEVRAAADWLRAESRSVATVYMGGGTPTVLSADQIARILEPALEPADSGAEITVEVNPGTIDLAKLKRLAEDGVNRLSIGAQSLDDAVLRSLSRIHSAEEARRAIDLAGRAGFDELSVDLMFGVPGQRIESFADTLDEVVALGAPHVSAYCLTFEEGTPLLLARQAGRVSEPDEGEVISMFWLAEEKLAEGALRRYEISNFARPGHECAHNLVYWRGGEYLGLGAAAHSFLGRERWWNTSDIDEYVRCISTAQSAEEGREALTADQRAMERAMLGLRLTEGLPLSELTPLGGTSSPTAPSTLQSLESRGLIKLSGGRVRLTRDGLIVADDVILELVG